MKAIIHEEYGDPGEALSLGDVDTPTPGEGEILVRVKATAVAKGDWLLARGLPYIARPMFGVRRPKRRIAGMETAGVVEAVGVGVAGFEKGDEVFGWADGGALAEFVSLPQGQLAHKPAGLTFEQAAAIPISGFAALQAIRRAGEAGVVGEGTKVLVIGASGGVGTFAVQIARAMGAEVTGVASTRNLDLVRDLGAAHAIDYTAESIADDGRRFDVIIDIAGNRSISELRRALTPRGTVVIVGGSGGNVTMGFGRTIRATILSPFVPQHLKSLLSKPNAEDLAALAEMAERGELTPWVDATYPLALAGEAIEFVGAGHSRGKTVVTV